MMLLIFIWHLSLESLTSCSCYRAKAIGCDSQESPRVLKEVAKNREEFEEDKPVIPPLALDAPKAAD
jgi:hypothetical protein